MESADRIFDKIRAVKLLHAEYSEKYKSSSSAAIELARKIWGFVPSYRYEPHPFDYDRATQKLMLAAIIAERLVLKRDRNLWKHVTVSIIGLGGSGKTTYSILSAYGALLLAGYSRDVAIKTVSALTFFSAKEFVEFVEMLINEQRWVPFIILDDIGSQISKYWIFLGQNFWAYLFSVLDQLKDWCGVLVLTARSEKSIPARMRELTDLVVEAKELDLGGNILDVFRYYLYDDYVSMRRRRHGLKFIDVLPPTARMPEDMWRKMLEVRRKTGKERISMVRTMLELQPHIERMKIERMKEKIKKGLEGGEDGEAEADSGS